MEKPIHDLVVFCGNFDSVELESYKICAIIDNPVRKRAMLLLRLNARDVFVRRSGALAFINILLGRPNVVGKLDLDKMRTVAVTSDLIFDIKPISKPNVRIAFPDNFDDLPDSFKQHKFFGEALKIGYLSMKNENAIREMMEEMGYSGEEIIDAQNQSFTKYAERMQQVRESLSQEVPTLKEVPPKKQVDEYQQY